MITAPIGIPDRTRVRSIHRLENESNGDIGVLGAGDGSGAERVGGGVAGIVFEKQRIFNRVYRSNISKIRY
jgi:hypothetical protein